MQKKKKTAKGGQQKLEEILFDFNLLPNDENSENQIDIWEKDQEKNLIFSSENPEQVRAGKYSF